MILSIYIYIRLLLSFIFYVFKGAAIVILYLKDEQKQQDKLIYDWSKKMLDIVQSQISLVGSNDDFSCVDFDPERRYIIMSNHVSLFDIPIIFQAFPFKKIRMIAKSELKKFHILAFVMKRFGFIFINRKNHQQAIKDLEIAKYQMLEKKTIIWVAPEGTRTLNPNMLGPLKKGGFILAMDTQAIIIPVWIQGSAKIIPAKTLQFKSNQDVFVCVGKPIDTFKSQIKTKEDLMDSFKYEINILQEKYREQSRQGNTQNE